MNAPSWGDLFRPVQPIAAWHPSSHAAEGGEREDRRGDHQTAAEPRGQTHTAVERVPSGVEELLGGAGGQLARDVHRSPERFGCGVLLARVESVREYDGVSVRGSKD